MYAKLSSLGASKAIIDHEEFAIDEMLFSWADRRLKYIAVQTGNWFHDDIVLIAASLAAPIDANGKIRMLVTKAELSDLPRSSADDSLAWPHLPPIVIGPFGSTQAPPLLLAQIASMAGAEPSADKTENVVDTGPLERMKDWIGKTVFGDAGVLGTLSDVVLDTSDNSLSHLVIDAEGESYALPITALRHPAKQGTHLIIEGTESQFRTAMRPENLLPN